MIHLGLCKNAVLVRRRVARFAAGSGLQRHFEGSGADWLDRYKPYIQDGKTVVTSPHKVYGPETNDLILQLRKRGIDRVILAGMSANLCTESHLRDLVEQGFEVLVVSDGTAEAVVPDGDGYQAALTNFRFIASAVRPTRQVSSELVGRQKAQRFIRESRRPAR